MAATKILSVYDLAGNKLLNLGTPTDQTDAANKDYVDTVFGPGSVTTVKLADDAVTNAKIADGAVNTAQLADDAVTSDKIANEAVTADEIADGAVTNDKIPDYEIQTAKLAYADTTSGANTIAVRQANGALAIGTPINSDDATTKQYVDDAISEVDYSAGDGISIDSAGSGGGYEINVQIADDDQLYADGNGLALNSDLWQWLTKKRSHAETIGDGSATTFTITHNLDTRDVMVQVYTTASPYEDVEVTVTRPTVNTVSLEFSGDIPSAGEYRVLVQSVGFAPVVDNP